MPTYGGQMCSMTSKSLLDLQALFAQYQIPLRFSFLMNESLIPRARSYLCDEFVNRSDCTHMMFIDSDIAFNAQDVLAMLALDKEICGGPYNKKTIKWENIKEAILKNPSIPVNQLESLVGDFVFNPVAGSNQFSVTEPVEVMEVGTGFMMIRREVFEKFKEAYPEQEVTPDHVGVANYDGSRNIHYYFDCIIDPQTKRYLSEDYYFTQMCKKIGIKVWMAPWIALSHIGTYSFNGSLVANAAHLGKL